MTFSINPTANKTQAMFEQMAIAQNGTGTASAITGGTTTTAVAPPSAATSSSATSGAMVSGTGSYNTDGSCECACLCGVAAYPNAAIQGIGGYGGLSGQWRPTFQIPQTNMCTGAIPMSALES
jgi:hypothetical protein